MSSYSRDGLESSIPGLILCDFVWCRADSDRKYKFVPVKTFVDAFHNTDTAKRMHTKLLEAPVTNPKAVDPLVQKLLCLQLPSHLQAVHQHPHSSVSCARATCCTLTLPAGLTCSIAVPLTCSCAVQQTFDYICCPRCRPRTNGPTRSASC